MSKAKDYKFQHQKKRFLLRVYPMHMAVKIFMDGTLREVTVQNTSTKPLLEYSFHDERNQEHIVKVERIHSWFKYFYTVYFNGQAIFKTQNNEPVNSN